MNVLLITADQWRGDCLGALGHPCLETPRLDELAAGGVLFRRHFGQATPCGPARASLHTGLYAMNHRSVTNGTPLDARHTTLAKEARKAGYWPILFGYTDTSHDPRALAPDDPRLRTYEGVCPGFELGLGLTEDYAPWLAHLARRMTRPPTLAELFGGPLGAPAPYAARDSESAFLTGAFLGWLARWQSDRPWFAHLSYVKPHPPWVAAAPYHALHDPDAVPAPIRAPSMADEAALHPWLAWKLAQPIGTGWFAKPASQGEAEIRRARVVYYGLIRELDDQIGRIIDALGERGELERTLIVVTADHGEMLGDHWLIGKDGFFRAAFHVPLIVRGPGVARGRVVDAVTEHVDLMPTLLSRLGVELPLQCDGHDLGPLLEGEIPAGWRQSAHYEHDFRDVETRAAETALGLEPDRCALAVSRGERYAYVHFAGLPALCFDLAEDPHELHDIVRDPGRATEILGQAQVMLDWRMAKAERRLTGCKLTPAGPIGRF